jgi:hypothetical protein
MKLDPGMHIGMHLVFFGKSGVTANDGERHVPTTASDDGGELGETAVAGNTERSHPYRPAVYFL